MTSTSGSWTGPPRSFSEIKESISGRTAKRCSDCFEVAEKAKVELSAVPETTLSLPFITADAAGPKHLEMKLTRAKFDALTADLVERCRGPFERALADAKLTAQDLDEVILVGGATRTPAVQALVRKMTQGKEPHQGVNPDEVVAVGAAIQAAVLAGEMKDVVLLDVTPLSLGVETLGGLLTKLVERNTTIPVRRSRLLHGGRQPDRRGHPRAAGRAGAGAG